MTKQEVEHEKKDQFEAFLLYKSLGDGISWNPPVVIFRSRKSAGIFQKSHQEFTVRYDTKENLQKTSFI